MKPIYWFPFLVILLLAVAAWQQSPDRGFVEKIPDNSVVVLNAGGDSETLTDVKEIIYMDSWMRVDRGEQGIRVYPVSAVSSVTIRLRGK